ncbi:hypothetical protein BOTBODRAFT_248388 [Botryobasidium botryosum FD-172 SS1]|uniref:Transcription factor domain-containing protein n=1 Tax=Botryobasidium botryosum (strain FD-172 SS1) TaxID=930990 RepID=A0A067MLL4_BOTB1|nr:hypothetical protein BOTBODRAFT_248388 [Botryobasidium botryosum FD-172 SS1]
MRTRHHLSQSLAHADRLLDFLDASSLLSSYFYAISRLEEGYHHASSAMLFAVACGLHCLAPPTWAPAEHQSLLPCVRDQSDLERRVRIWWRVFAVDRTANTLGNCPILVPDDKIKTPWVVPPHALVTNRAFTEAELSTVQSLYRAQSDAPRVLDDNVEVLRLKGIVLLERASSLGRLAPTTPRADTVFWHTFVSTDEALNQFIACLPPLYDKRGTETLVPDAVRAFEGMNPFLVVIHTFAFTARLRLHSRLAQADSITSYDHSIEAIQGAMSVVDKISSLDVGEHLSALASVCWQSIFVFLAAEYKTIQNTRQHETRAAETRAALKSIFSVIHKMAKYFPVLCEFLEPLWKLRRVRSLNA